MKNMVDQFKKICKNIGRIKSINGMLVCVVEAPKGKIIKTLKKFPVGERLFVFSRGSYGPEKPRFPEDFVPNEIVKIRKYNPNLMEFKVFDPAETFYIDTENLAEEISKRDIILTDEKSFEKEADKYEWEPVTIEEEVWGG
ncbi:MAG: hypothetical protein ACTSWZ_07665 [Candidatus Heimdallarchaeaceae archaeon]